jgi:hypothetical protein
MWIFDGNVNELGDVGRGPGKSYLFSLTAYHPEINLFGARVQRLVEHNTFVVSGAFLTILENPRERITFTPGRTHNRSRSPR